MTMLEEHEKLLFTGANDFSQFIEKIASETNDTYVDTVLNYCKENFLEPEDIKSLVSQSLRDKLEVEFQDSRMLPKGATLY
jgi:hypothetical protein